ncbi:hypothetical protein [Dyadobacter sp. CY312]|uniref:hypothetical protein n=1 Tax=Dyadobacter sp. CY312 TaxID=2907303 RepID=UPI001F3F5CF6|nr:hypothetical protein [Dyadobacter sp. CY312]MCE7040659.1 hypothetical protein [Dyadobacter sp. CY312]
MKSNLLYTVFFLATLLSVPVSNALPKDNKSDSNALLLNGKNVDMSLFSWVTRGKLSLSEGNSETKSLKRVPFYAYIKRAGKIVDAQSHAHNHAVMEIEMAEILKKAIDGDQIVVDPAGKNENAGRKIIVVKQKQFMYNFDWWLGLNKKSGNGC